jgi:hypothetical protein
MKWHYTEVDSIVLELSEYLNKLNSWGVLPEHIKIVTTQSRYCVHYYYKIEIIK